MRWMVAGDPAPCDTAKWTPWGWESGSRHDNWSPDGCYWHIILSSGSRPAGGGGAPSGGWSCSTRWRTSSYSPSLSRLSRPGRSGSDKEVDQWMYCVQCINKMFGGYVFFGKNPVFLIDIYIVLSRSQWSMSSRRNYFSNPLHVLIILLLFDFAFPWYHLLQCFGQSLKFKIEIWFESLF